MTKNQALLREIYLFLKTRKKWWLIPVIIMFIFLGMLIIYGQSTVVSPFIYALF